MSYNPIAIVIALVFVAYAISTPAAASYFLLKKYSPEIDVYLTRGFAGFCLVIIGGVGLWNFPEFTALGLVIGLIAAGYNRHFWLINNPETTFEGRGGWRESRY